MINILTDSTSDIPRDLCKKYHIGVIPMYIQFKGKTYMDGEDIDPQSLFEQVQETGIYPTTSAPSPEDFHKFFDRPGPSIYIGVSSKLSTTFQNAQLAHRHLRDKTLDLIDSLSISTAYGQAVLKAAEWRNKGMGFAELGHRIREFIKKSRGIFILDCLDYLFHGGRCSMIEHFVSSLLKIHPFLHILPNGILGVKQKVRGERIRAVKVLRSFFLEQLMTYNIKEVILTHLDCDDEVQYLKDEIRKISSLIQVSIAEVGCVLAMHSGPKPLGIAYNENSYSTGP